MYKLIELWWNRSIKEIYFIIRRRYKRNKKFKSIIKNQISLLNVTNLDYKDLMVLLTNANEDYLNNKIN